MFVSFLQIRSYKFANANNSNGKGYRTTCKLKFVKIWLKTDKYNLTTREIRYKNLIYALA